MAPTPSAAGGSMPVGTARFIHSSLMLAIAALAAAHLLGALAITPDPNAGLVLGFFALVLVVVGAVASKAMQARGVAWVRAHPDEARASIQAGRLPVAYFASSFIPAAINEGASFVALIALLLGGPLHLWVVVGFALLQIWLTTPSLAKLEQALT